MNNLKLFPELGKDGTQLLLNLLLNCEKQTIVCQGGRRAGKSFAIFQLFILRSIINRDQIRVVVGWDMPHMKKGCIMDTLRIFNLYTGSKEYLKSYNRQETTFYFRSGSIIQFSSFEDENDAKMTDIEDFDMNEANHIKNGYAIFQQMQMQCRGQSFIEYNPTFPFWAHAKLIGRPDVEVFYNDHRSNIFLSDQQHRIIETQYKPGSELFKAYARGKTAQLEGSIYKNWRRIDKWPNGIEEVIWSTDYGYSVGKTAIMKTGIIGHRKLVTQLLSYEPGIAAEDIKKIMENNGYVSGAPFYSEHDEIKVSELRRLGMIVQMAIKGEKSEWNGILKCQEFEVEYVYSEELETERISYQWDTVMSLETGDEILTQSVKDTKKYHAMAAFRYGVFTHFFGN
jgi:phage terminase large subunit